MTPAAPPGTQPVRTQVVVVGAGPVGLLLAGELRLGGAEVVVLERRRHPITESRASTLHARTMEILDSRGLLTQIGVPPNQHRGHLAGIPLDLTRPSSHPGQWKVLQTRLESVLQQRALAAGARVRRGLCVRAVQQQDDMVTVTADGRAGPTLVQADYLVGCDGEDSTVRRLLGADFPGQDAGRELLRADVRGIDIPDRRFARLEHGLAVAARRPDGVTRVMVHEFGSTPRFDGRAPELDLDDFGSVVEAWKRVTGEDISGGTPIWVNSFGDANRQLAGYRHGRVLFAGDAAHRQLPIGGQALNLGLQDAFNLGWKLALRLRTATAEPVLDSYHRERHAVGARVLTNIRAQAGLLLGGPEVEPLRALLGELIDLPSVTGHLAATIAGLDVCYEVGPGRHRLLGAQLPSTLRLRVAGRLTTPAELLRSGRGVLLVLSGGERPPGARPARPVGWARRVDLVRAEIDSCVECILGKDFSRTMAMLLRPDGHLVWTAEDGTGAGLSEALSRWFGAEGAAGEHS